MDYNHNQEYWSQGHWSDQEEDPRSGRTLRAVALGAILALLVAMNGWLAWSHHQLETSLGKLRERSFSSRMEVAQLRGQVNALEWEVCELWELVGAEPEPDRCEPPEPVTPTSGPTELIPPTPVSTESPWPTSEPTPP